MITGSFALPGITSRSSTPSLATRGILSDAALARKVARGSVAERFTDEYGSRNDGAGHEHGAIANRARPRTAE